METKCTLSNEELGDRLKAMHNLLEKYEELEAMLIADNAMWWPHVEKDAISGQTYDMMMELQAKRNELLGRQPLPTTFRRLCAVPT